MDGPTDSTVGRPPAPPAPPPLHYAPAAPHRPSRALAALANLSFAYPPLLLTLLYGQWLLSGYMLGHAPRPSVDDPKDIAGASWMHSITGIALVLLIPAGCAAVALNVFHFVDQRLRPRCVALRAGALVSLWFGTVALLRSDPGGVLYWWFD